MIKIHPIPAYQDNYIWLIMNDQNQAIVIDPGDATPVLDYCEQNNVIITHILITHHHQDHVGGIEQLLIETTAKLFCPELYPHSLSHKKYQDNDEFFLTQYELNFKVIATPGHTLDHICYYTPGHLFCGDTLFACGCGRIFEGTPTMMLNSLNKIKALPADTLIYCAHEYTQQNCRFAISVEPENIKLQQRLKEVERLTSNQHPTLPSQLQDEFDTNPFLRCHEKTIIQAVSDYKRQEINDEVQVFTTLRQWKDNF